MSRFPFGQPSTERPPRPSLTPTAKVFVLGVYPSALHVRWTLPKPVGARTEIRALAVDDEPEVFWDGADQVERIGVWKEAVGFIDGDHGYVAPVVHNGSSGRAVIDEVLGPLGVDVSKTWFADCVPTYFMKSGRGQQAEAVAVYNVLAPELALEPADLTPRPSTRELVSRSERGRLRGEIWKSHAPTVVTLGEEARLALRGATSEVSGPPSHPLSIEDYGLPGDGLIGDHLFTWYALKHPGQRSEKWRLVHRAWTPERVVGGLVSP